MADSARDFIYMLRPKRTEMLTNGPTAEEARVIKEHSRYLERLAEKGVVRLAGRSMNNDETTFELAIIRAADMAAAREVMERDPFVSSGLMIATLFPFHVVCTSN
jgi:uncharacterized protein YciI